MDYFIALNQILILFLPFGVGFFCRCVGILDEASITSLSKFLLHICIPAMIIYSMLIPFASELLHNSELRIGLWLLLNRCVVRADSSACEA